MGRIVIQSMLINWLLIAAATSAAPAYAVAAAGQRAMSVGGWPIPDLTQARPPTSLGDDPVLGRQACPPMIRLDLDSGESEVLLIKRVVKSANGTEWRFETKGDIFWWGGASVSSQDVAAFVAETLPRVIKDRGLTLWPVPKFDVKAESRAVIVTWQSAPKFGPYILDGVPLARSATGDGLSFECAGLYKMASTPQGVTMTPNPAYKIKQAVPTIQVQREVAKMPTGGLWMALRAANTYGGTPWTRLSDDKPKCSATLDLPSATVIAWNPQRGVTGDKALRALLTELTPRGELVRSGAAALGELISAPIPKQHPGYDARLTVRPFNIDNVSASLHKLGYQRQDAYAPRMDKQGKPLRLTLLSASGTPGLAEKVVSDTYSSIGISTTFKSANEASSDAADGVFAAVQFDWPRADLIGTFHSHATDSKPFYRLDDKQLDALLERYALSLTELRPDFAALTAVHRRIFELEPMTVLLQHKACIEVGGGLKLPPKGISIRDPDWFRKLIL